MKISTLIEIQSKHHIDDYLLEDLSGNVINAKNGKEIELENNWYLLQIPYQGQSNDIHSIKINDCDIEYLIYVGYFENSRRERFQPATAVWEEGNYNLWIHPNAGIMTYHYINEISNGDFGTDLFKKYMLTVDRPIKLKNDYPKSVEQFFAHGFGPNWWPKNESRPYMTLENDFFDKVDRKKLVDQIKNFVPHHENRQIGNENQRFIIDTLKDCVETTKEWIDEEYFISSDDVKGVELKELLHTLKFKSVMDICVHNLTPATSLHIHIDDPKARKSWPYIKGCKRFYWIVENSENNYLKLGEAGAVPMDKPMMINTQEFAHAVVNDSDKMRTAIIIEGVLDDNLDFSL